MQELIDKITKQLNKNSLPPSVIRSKFKTGFEQSSLYFDDPTYLPFYYYLGTFLKGTKNLIEFGFDLGMPSGSFMDGCKTIEHFLAFKKKSDKYFAYRLGVSNIHNFLRKKFNLWVGNETDPEFIKMLLDRKWDCAIIADRDQKEPTQSAYLDLIWNQMADGGFVFVDELCDPVVKKVFDTFCKTHNRKGGIIPTLRLTGILRK